MIRRHAHKVVTADSAGDGVPAPLIDLVRTKEGARRIRSRVVIVRFSVANTGQEGFI